MKDFIKGSAKAIVAGISAAVAYAAPVVDDGYVASEWLLTLGAFLGAFTVVYFVDNKGPKSPYNPDAVPDPQEHLPGL